jgi:hypothetical protein
MLRNLLIVILSTALIGCSNTTLQVEVQNNSDQKIDLIMVATGSGRSITDFENVAAESNTVKEMRMYMELEEDGHYFINIPELDIRENHGYYTGGGPVNDRMIITIQGDSIDVDFKND